MAISSSVFHQVTRKVFGEPERSFAPSSSWATGSNAALRVHRTKGTLFGAAGERGEATLI